jgi:heat-inducible transcriptional repressor
VLEPDGVSVAIGEELDDPALRRCALVASPYGGGAGREPLGVLGVIGPSRMDFARVISLVDYLSQGVTGKLLA